MDKIHRYKDKPKFLKCQFGVKQKTFDKYVNYCPANNAFRNLKAKGVPKEPIRPKRVILAR